MTEAGVSHNIKGSWRGCYFYSDSSPDEVHGFEAVFVEMDGVLQGNILDDDDLGEADVAGTFSYPQLSFLKRYRAIGTKPVKYIGSMTDDGTKLQGTWHLADAIGGVSGTWIARRIKDGDDLTLPDQELEKVNEVEMQRERVLVPRRRRSSNQT